jgi:hypothetical protein
MEAKQQILVLETFNVIGCPDLGIYIACPATRQQVQLAQRNKLTFDTTKITTLLGTDKPIDVILVYVEKGTVWEASRGNKEINNVIFHTYKLHKQYHECLVTMPIEIDLHDKTRSVASHILSSLTLFTEQQMVNINKQKRRLADMERVTYGISLMMHLTPNINAPAELRQLVVLSLQTLLLKHKTYAYTLQELNAQFGKIYVGKQKITFDTDFVKFLHDELMLIVKIINDEFVWHDFDLDTKTIPTGEEHLTDLIHEFYKSSITPTDQFLALFDKQVGVGIKPSINKMFPNKCFGGEKLPHRVRDRVFLVDPRSPEWLTLLTKYKCGRNSGLRECPKDTHFAKFYYNLIRGSIVESSVVTTVDYKSLLGCDYHKVMVGLFVADKKEGSDGVAPDLLLVVDDEIIPVEIKCIVCDSLTSPEYRRAVHLAKLQLQSTLKITGGKRGIITIIQVSEKNKQIKGYNAIYTTA